MGVRILTSNTANMAEAGLMLLKYNTDYNNLSHGIKVHHRGILDSVILSLKKTGSAVGLITMTIRDDSGGNPNAVLATQFGTLDASSLTTSFAEYTFTFTGANKIVLLPNTQYHIHITNSNVLYDSANYVGWNHVDSTTQYADGDGKRQNSGGSWFTQRDAYFIVKGYSNIGGFSVFM